MAFTAGELPCGSARFVATKPEKDECERLVQTLEFAAFCAIDCYVIKEALNLIFATLTLLTPGPLNYFVTSA